MTKSKIINKTLCITILFLFLAVVFLALSQQRVVLAQTSDEKLILTDINYSGTQNHCYYDLVIDSDSITKTGSEIKVTNLNNFIIYMLGKSCNKTITLIKFEFDLNFLLLKDGVEVKSKDIDFTIKKENEVKDKTKTVFTSEDLTGEGFYTIHITGQIKSVATEKINKIVYFTVE